LVFAAFAVRSVHYPANSERARNPNDVDRNEKVEESIWAPSTYEPITTLTFALVLVAVGQAVLFVWQLSLIRDGAKDTAIAAKAASRSADTAERALTELERPFVMVSSVRSNLADAIAEVISEPPCPFVKITIKNFGRTPAIIETLGSRIRLSGDDSLLPVMDAQNLVLGPGDIHEFKTTYDGAYGQGIAYQIRGGFITVWLAFYIKYQDIFGTAHETAADWKYYRFDEFHPPSGPRYHTIT